MLIWGASLEHAESTPRPPGEKLPVAPPDLSMYWANSTPSTVPQFKKVTKKADWIKTLTCMEAATWDLPLFNIIETKPNENVCGPFFMSIHSKNGSRHVELFQSAGQACKYTNPGIQPTHLCPTWKPQQTGLEGWGKTGARPTQPRRDEKQKAFRPSCTSAAQRPSEAYPKVCIYFHSPLLISTHMLPLTPVHPRKGNVSVI